MVDSASTTVRLRYVVSVPPVLVAVMVNMLRESISVGVPLMVPFAVFKDKPEGSDGETE